MSKPQNADETKKIEEKQAHELAEARRRIAELEASVTEHKQIEESLRVSEERYRSVVEDIGIGITLIDRDHKIIMVNPAQGRIFHKPPSEFIGKNCFEEFEKRDTVCPHCPGVRAIATGRPAMVETSGIRDDGSVNFARIRAFPVLNAEGAPTDFIEVVVDITEQKLAEEARRQSEERFRLLVEHAADGFFLHDSEARILDVNRHACESLGYTREELLSLSIQAFDQAFDSRELKKWKQLVPGKPVTFERVHTRKDGTTFPVEVRLGVFETGEHRLFLALARDMTEHKRAEEALARRALHLQAGAEISQVASSTLDSQDLTQQVVDLICKRFDLYYVGLFLVDQTHTLYSQPGEWTSLQAATGEAGQTMLKQGYRLKVGDKFMVGQCIAKGEPCLALDVDKKATRKVSSSLPDTRSELALPLISHGEVIGALAIHSSQEDAFSEDDVVVLQIMAGQVANSIENARLYKQAQAALEELKTIHRRHLRQAWGHFLGEDSKK